MSACNNNPEPTWQERADFGRIFAEAGVDGSFLLYDLKVDTYLVYESADTDTPYTPASTFKVFHSLVALETGVITDSDKIISWDGTQYPFPNWNGDQTLPGAFSNSVVWAYQEIARRVGEEQMQQYIDAVGYGNGDISGGIDQFWLIGNLRITPRQQIDFLTRLYNGDLPFSERSMEIVKEIMIVEQTDSYTLRAKTGRGIVPPKQIGWYVGWVERDGNPYFFATRLDLPVGTDGKVRKTTTRAILTELNLLEEDA